jgi:glycosyltransferase involved in cell wall biosynthesis
VRIAWIGPTPNDDGGARYVGTVLLRELACAGAEIDCFLGDRIEEIPPELRGLDGVRFVLSPTSWRWGRWYNRTPLLAFVSGSLFRLRAQWKLARSIAERHARAPYDVVYQFSQSELGGLRKLRASLPPIVVHPSTHAAGELGWYRREAHLARRLEPLHRRLLVRIILTVRATVQRRDLPQAARVLGVSRRFAEHLAADYPISPERLGVVVNPIDLKRFHPGERVRSERPLKLLFVSRISVRKGVDLIVELSHRLADLRGEAEIVIIGGATTWSDYRKLLDDLNPDIATYAGEISHDELACLYQEALAVLQPSQYEPFALTVGEALASGTPVIGSDEVGAIDGIDPRVCSVFPRGDLDAFERAVRDAIKAAGSVDRRQLATLARAEAERLFAPATVAAKLLNELQLASAARPRHPATTSERSGRRYPDATSLTPPI